MKAVRWLALCLAWLALPAQAEPAKPHVVATFSILGDIVAVVGGENISVTVLVGADEDTHVFEPTAEHVRAISKADLFIANGLGFETWLERLIEAADYRGKRVLLGETIDAMPAPSKPHDHGHDDHDHGHEAHDHGEFDPHGWQDPRNGAAYARAVAEALAEVDPTHAALYRARAEAYAAELNALYVAKKAKFDALPNGRRGFVTAHASFSYFARAYGLRVMAIEGLSTESEPSAGDVAEIIRQIREGRAVAIFVENIANARLAEQVAQEGGVAIGGRLYSDALSPSGGPAASYRALIEWNANQVLAALSGAIVQD